jgi:WD40 repeat protein
MSVAAVNHKRIKPNPIPTAAPTEIVSETINSVVSIILSYLSPTHHVSVVDYFCGYWKHPLPGDRFWTHLFHTQFALHAFDCTPSEYQEFADNSAVRTWDKRNEQMVSFESLISENISLTCSVPIPHCSKLHSPLKIAAIAGSILQVRDAQNNVTFRGNHQKELEIMAYRAKSAAADFPSTRAVSYLAASPDGETIATGFREGEIFFWDLSSQGTKRTLELADADPRPGELTTLEHIAFAQNGTLLAAYAASSKGFLCKWDPKTLKRKQKIEVPGYHVESFSLTKDGKRAFVQVSDTIPFKEQTQAGNSFRTVFHEYNFSNETTRKITPPGPPNGMVWKGGFTVATDDRLVAAIRQGDNPTELWAFSALPSESVHLMSLQKGEEITSLQAGMNRLLYAITNQNRFFVYDLNPEKMKLIHSFSSKKDPLLTLQLAASRSAVTVAKKESGTITTFDFSPHKIATPPLTAAASSSSSSAASAPHKRKAQS